MDDDLKKIGPFRPGHRLTAREMGTLRLAGMNPPQIWNSTQFRWATAPSGVPARNTTTNALGFGPVTLLETQGWDTGVLIPTEPYGGTLGATTTAYNPGGAAVAVDALIILGRVDNIWVVIWEECEEDAGGGGGGGELPPMTQLYNFAWGVITITENYVIPRDSVFVLVSKPDLIINTSNPLAASVSSPRFRLRGIDYIDTCLLSSQGGPIERQDLPGNFIAAGVNQTIRLPTEYIWDATAARWVLWDFYQGDSLLLEDWKGGSLETQPRLLPRRASRLETTPPLK